jgi:hypothetical protein
MPEISRFLGIIVRMYAEAATRHRSPHFHVYYQDNMAVYGIDPVRRISGSVPLRQRRLVEAWAELHHQELQANWNRLMAGRKPAPISPLQ